MVPEEDVVAPLPQSQQQDALYTELVIPASSSSYKDKAKGRSFGLSLDIEIINKDYLYGGDNLKKTAIDEDEIDRENEEIAELARLCVMHMRGELKNGETDFYE
jgi:hypothetical protein